MYLIQRTLTNFSWIYFLLVVILGNFFLLNLNLAILKVKFTESCNMITYQKNKKHRNKMQYDLFKLKKDGLWESKSKSVFEIENNELQIKQNKKKKQKKTSQIIDKNIFSIKKSFKIKNNIVKNRKSDLNKPNSEENSFKKRNSGILILTK